MQSYTAKGKEYLIAFPKKRLLPFYAMMSLLIAIYAIYKLLMGIELTFLQVVQSFLFGGTVISNGWYLQVQLLCYVVFYAVFRLGKKDSTCVCVTTLLVMMYVIASMLFNQSMTWHVSTPLFFAGLWYAYLKTKIDCFLTDNIRWMGALLASGMLVLTMLLGSKFVKHVYLDAVFLTLSELAFVSCVLLVISRVRIDCRLTRMLGAISLEVYVMQGMCLSFFHGRYVNIRNPYLYVLAATVSTIVLAIIVHPIIKRIFLLCGGTRGESKQKETSKVSE